jgi:hypothetical protein
MLFVFSTLPIVSAPNSCRNILQGKRNNPTERKPQ